MSSLCWPAKIRHPLDVSSFSKHIDCNTSFCNYELVANYTGNSITKPTNGFEPLNLQSGATRTMINTSNTKISGVQNPEILKENLQTNAKSPKNLISKWLVTHPRSQLSSRWAHRSPPPPRRPARGDSRGCWSHRKRRRSFGRCREPGTPRLGWGPLMKKTIGFLGFIFNRKLSFILIPQTVATLKGFLR